MWVRRFVRHHVLRHPAHMAEAEINAVLTHLAVECHVSASTRVVSALLFLYRHVVDREVGSWWTSFVPGSRRGCRSC